MKFRIIATLLLAAVIGILYVVTTDPYESPGGTDPQSAPVADDNAYKSLKIN